MAILTVMVSSFSSVLTLIICRLQGSQQSLGMRIQVQPIRVMVAADKCHGHGSGARLGCQICAPFSMLFSHDEWPAQSVQRPCSPASPSTPKETSSQHNHYSVYYGQAMQDFSHIVQEGSRQQIRFGLPGCFQVSQYLKSMGLFRRLHPAEETELVSCKIGQEAFIGDALSGAEQGVPELARAVSKTGYHHGITPAVVVSLGISVTNKEFGGIGRASPAQ
jgi:hypothetical protein